MEEKKDNKMKIIILGIITLIILVLSTTFSFFIWNSNTNQDIDVAMSLSGLDAYIHYNKGTDVLTGTLLSSTDYSGGISTEIELWKDPSAESRIIYGHIYLDITTIGTNLANEPALKWAITSNGEVLNTGNFVGQTNGNSIKLKVNIPLRITKELYQIYIWLDESMEINKAIEGETISTIVRAEASEILYNGIETVEVFPISDTTPGELVGNGTKNDPYLIESIEDLVSFSNSVNSGNTYEGEYVKLLNNLDFNYDGSYVDPNNTSLFGDYNVDGITEGIKEEITRESEQGFIPIGYITDGNTTTSTRYSFNGIFDGNNKAILNIFINYNDQSSYVSDTFGLFGLIEAAEISNLMVSGNIDVNSSDAVTAGGITSFNDGGVIINCSNYINIHASSDNSKVFIGGIVSHNISNIANAVVKNCINMGEFYADSLSGSESGIGGIVAYNSINSEIVNSINGGKGEGTNENGDMALAAGIVSYNMGTVSSSINLETGITKSLANNSKAFSGGVVSVNKNKVINCINYAEISSISLSNESNVGGIVAYNLKSTTDAIVNNSVNYGKIIMNNNSGSKNSIGGGIVGLSDGGIVDMSYNYGEINATTSETNYSGGLVGNNRKNSSIMDSINYGMINSTSLTGNTFAGGIAGYNTSSSIATSANFGDINVIADSVEAPAGGIAAYNRDSTIDSCYNVGSISGTSSGSYIRVGGITGNNWSSSSTSIIKNSYNIGEISGNGATGTYLGGISGRNTGTISYSYYLDTVASAIYGNGTSTNVTNSGSKTSKDMQTDTFTALLNTGLTTDVWNTDYDGINNKYPTLNFQNPYSYTYLKDLSPNGYDAKLYGAEIVSVDGQKAIKFDGVDDFVKVPILPETIDFVSGYTVEVTMKWNKLDEYMGIMDFGNNVSLNNLVIDNWGTHNTLRLRYFNGSTQNYFKYINITLSPNVVEKYKIVLTKGTEYYNLKIYLNDTLKTNNSNQIPIGAFNNVQRISNFIGRKNYTVDPYLSGYIYEFKILDSNNNPILHYDADNIFVK